MKTRKSKLNKPLSFIMLAFLVLMSVCVVVAPIVWADADPIDGWAVIVTGSYLPCFFNGSMIAYDACLNCGCTDDTIYCLDAINRTQRMDALATKENVESAITGWLGNRSDNNDICLIFLHNHGGEGYFDLDLGPQNTTAIYYYELNEWLVNVSYGRLMFVVDACHSGSCISELSGKDRIIISSCKESELMGPGIFSEYFWPKTVNMNVMDAFNDAAWYTLNFTEHLPHPGPPDEGDWPQHPQLDDNEDGIGHWDPEYPPLPNEDDGYLAQATRLNPAMMANLAVSTSPSINATVWINENISRNSPVHVILTQGSYTVKVNTSFTHWNFNHWDDNSTSNPRNLTLSEDKTLTAHFSWINNPPNIPSTPSGETNGYAGTSYSYSTNTNDTNGDTVRYEFDWGDSTQHDITGLHPSGENVTAQHHWSSPETYYVQVRAQDCPPYETWSNWSLNLQVTISNGGGGEGCPMLFVWNGTDYAYEGLLNIHNTEGIDILTNHTLLTTPQRVGYTYLFRLTEHNQTHSYIDQVKLYAVLENGMVIQLPLIWAWHSEYGNVLSQLLFSDNWRTETIGAIHNNGTSQTINLRFLALPPNIKVTAYIFQIEGYNPEFKQ